MQRVSVITEILLRRNFLRIMPIFYGFVILCLIGSALAQVTGRASCPQIEADKKFVADDFVGTWYEIFRFYTHYLLNSKCNRLDVSQGRNSSTYKLRKSLINNFTGNKEIFQSEVVIPDPKRNPGKGLIEFPMSPTGAVFNSWVVASKYDMYYITYGCTLVDSTAVEYSFVLSRVSKPTKATMNEIHRVIRRKKIDIDNYIKVNQKDCDDDEID